MVEWHHGRGRLGAIVHHLRVLIHRVRFLLCRRCCELVPGSGRRCALVRLGRVGPLDEHRTQRPGTSTAHNDRADVRRTATPRESSRVRLARVALRSGVGLTARGKSILRTTEGARKERERSGKISSRLK